MKAIYPGTFDPVTYGHLDVITRGVKIFSTLIIAVAENAGKEPLFSLEERVQLLKDATSKISGIEITTFDSLLVNYALQCECNVIIRGLRAVSDFEFEFQMALMNKKMSPDIETFFMMPDEKYTYLSSRAIKEISKLGGDISKFVPGAVKEKLLTKFPRRS
ncbi:MAG: phosphopantetheine adenylyltransferase [uncultured bacterium]|nr:MAG: phosphopantetheine adenylyltransferase [uncultured bacterium]